MTLIRLQRWDDFKASAVALNPTTIFYSIEEAPLKKPPIALRLRFYHERDTYLFLDFAQGAVLQKTGVPVYGHEKRAAYVEEEDIKRFITTQLGRENIEVEEIF